MPQNTDWTLTCKTDQKFNSLQILKTVLIQLRLLLQLLAFIMIIIIPGFVKVQSLKHSITFPENTLKLKKVKCNTIKQNQIKTSALSRTKRRKDRQANIL